MMFCWGCMRFIIYALFLLPTTISIVYIHFLHWYVGFYICIYPPTDLSDHNFKLSLGIKRQKSVPIKKMQKFNQMLHAILKWWHLSFILLLFEFDGLSWLRLVLSFFFWNHGRISIPRSEYVHKTIWIYYLELKQCIVFT